MEKPVLRERFTDNGEHSHWELTDVATNEILWSEGDDKETGEEIPNTLFKRI